MFNQGAGSLWNNSSSRAGCLRLMYSIIALLFRQLTLLLSSDTNHPSPVDVITFDILILFIRMRKETQQARFEL
jgi:hypothetical protein